MKIKTGETDYTKIYIIQTVPHLEHFLRTILDKKLFRHLNYILFLRRGKYL